MIQRDRSGWVDRDRDGPWWFMLALSIGLVAAAVLGGLQHGISRAPRWDWARAVSTSFGYALVGFGIFMGGARYALRCLKSGKRSIFLYRPPGGA